MGKISPSYGVQHVRLRREHMDLADHNTIYQLKEQIKERPGCKMTISLPCTVWCQWQQMAIARYGKPYLRKLNKRRAQAVEMLTMALEVAQLVLDLGEK